MAVRVLTTDEHCREDISRTMKQSRYLVVVEMEIRIVVVVISAHGILTVDLATGDKCRLTTYLTQVVKKVACLLP